MQLRTIKLIDVCPQYKSALDDFEADPTPEKWNVVTEAARAFRAKVRELTPA